MPSLHPDVELYAVPEWDKQSAPVIWEGQSGLETAHIVTGIPSSRKQLMQLSPLLPLQHTGVQHLGVVRGPCPVPGGAVPHVLVRANARPPAHRHLVRPLPAVCVSGGGGTPLSFPHSAVTATSGSNSRPSSRGSPCS